MSVLILVLLVAVAAFLLYALVLRPKKPKDTPVYYDAVAPTPVYRTAPPVEVYEEQIVTPVVYTPMYVDTYPAEPQIIYVDEPTYAEEIVYVEEPTVIVEETGSYYEDTNNNY